jgi:hypothetical protein
MIFSRKVLHSGEAQAVVIVKASPQVGKRHGETVCCAAVDLHGNWLRLYPVAFRTLDEGQKFGRWDLINFKWRMTTDDPRIESRRIDQQSLSIVGELKAAERERFLSKLIVTGLDGERAAGKSLALLKATIMAFKIEEKTADEVSAERLRFDALRRQPDLFNSKYLLPYEPCPYRFKYKYKTDDGVREGSCQDWETEATFYHLRKRYGDQQAISKMNSIFGKEYPSKGMLLAMGTHSAYPNTWLINGVIRLNEIKQLTLF